MSIAKPRAGSIWSSPLMAKNVADYNRSMDGAVKWAPRIATAAAGGLLGSAAVPALFGGGAATSAPAFGLGAANTGAWSSSLPMLSTASSGMTLGKILSNPLTSLGVNTVTSLLGARSANKANQYAVDRNAEGLARQMALEEARVASETAERQAQRDEDRRRWEAQEAHNARLLAASEEERLYERRLREERESRRAAYESQYREPALRNLRSILGF